ncbi:endodeoxyribonuclease [Coniosporium tulheliwenetii]|uniref:Endodeoxyribonuclease n=1 Tax=Coniosporium tulheliwenetii TaxID=3383036 RepID=A0ACC2YY05_9PEZI|nr:endodeoxyribonuclease [Cladosporium sp. JES 115]
MRTPPDKAEVIRRLEVIFENITDTLLANTALFVKQAVVDRYVDDIACAFGVPRLSLNVGLLIPNVNLTDRFRLSRVSWILVVEKEATFRSLASSNFWDTLVSSGIMITAKGYPDVATRTFLRAISTPSPQNGFRCAPVYALMDYDPDGIAIMSTYKYGSFALAHENTKLVVPQMGWLGIRSSVLPSCAAALTESSNHGNEDANGESNVHQVQGLLRLTTRDRRKALKMLEWDVFAENGPEPRWRMEFQVMLMLNVKAEIQIMEAQTGGLAGWLQAELNGL